MPPSPLLPTLLLPQPPAFFQNIGYNAALSFLLNLDNNDGNNDPLFLISKHRSNFNKGLTFTQTEPLTLMTSGTHKSVLEIDLLPKVKNISDVEKIIPKN